MRFATGKPRLSAAAIASSLKPCIPRLLMPFRSPKPSPVIVSWVHTLSPGSECTATPPRQWQWPVRLSAGLIRVVPVSVTEWQALRPAATVPVPVALLLQCSRQCQSGSVALLVAVKAAAPAALLSCSLLLWLGHSQTQTIEQKRNPAKQWSGCLLSSASIVPL